MTTENKQQKKKKKKKNAKRREKFLKGNLGPKKERCAVSETHLAKRIEKKGKEEGNNISGNTATESD